MKLPSILAGIAFVLLVAVLVYAAERNERPFNRIARARVHVRRWIRARNARRLQRAMGWRTGWQHTH